MATDAQTPSQRKVAILAAIAGILVGSGGLLGALKYFDAREVDTLKRQLDAATAKSALVDAQLRRVAELEKALTDTKTQGPVADALRSTLVATLADVEFLLQRPDLPGWAKDPMEAARRRIREGLGN